MDSGSCLALNCALIVTAASWVGHLQRLRLLRDIPAKVQRALRLPGAPVVLIGERPRPSLRALLYLASAWSNGMVVLLLNLVKSRPSLIQ